MTVATTDPSAPPAVSAHLLPVLDAAAHASADAHEATRSLSDAMLSCLRLPAEVYQHVPQLSPATEAVTAAGRALTAAAGHALADPSPERLSALHQATGEVRTAAAALRAATHALRTAAAWYAEVPPLPRPDPNGPKNA
jgi:hypothetical protein